ncbi:hypothetical protein [Patulibacter defluvii]|uniref:hypothetical protein n=1 Tax=Patulibacter defluvii TaxID=3095358 RepID=UPI002A755235|nr:hypothetical protein [Patulibacter sp. DM4]
MSEVNYLLGRLRPLVACGLLVDPTQDGGDAVLVDLVNQHGRRVASAVTGRIAGLVESTEAPQNLAGLVPRALAIELGSVPDIPRLIRSDVAILQALEERAQMPGPAGTDDAAYDAYVALQGARRVLTQDIALRGDRDIETAIEPALARIDAAANLLRTGVRA